MAKNTIDPEDLGKAISKQLTLYRESVVEKINAAGKRAIKRLVSITEVTAPRRSGDYRKNITYKVVKKNLGDEEFIWGVKGPFYRLTHLLVKGHATRDGGRVDPDPFLQNALNEVLPDYEQEVEEAVKE